MKCTCKSTDDMLLLEGDGYAEMSVSPESVEVKRNGGGLRVTVTGRCSLCKGELEVVL